MHITLFSIMPILGLKNIISNKEFISKGGLEETGRFCRDGTYVLPASFQSPSGEGKR
jgi:hypothetical protein